MKRRVLALVVGIVMLPGWFPRVTAAEATPAVTEIPKPLPPMGREARRVALASTPLKHGRGLRSARAQSRPITMPWTKFDDSPFYFAGYLSFLSGGDSYQGSGTVVRPRSVLTAAHNLWDPTSGWSSNIRFDRGRYGSSYLGRSAPNRIYIHGNYQPNALSRGDTSAYTFAWDIGWMTFPAAVARGGYAGYARSYGALTGANYCIAVGYGGGVFPKYCEPARSYRQFGTTAYFTNSSYDHQGGMSGGPIFATLAGKRYVTAVVVSSGGGVRAIDGEMFSRLSKLP